MVNRSLILAVVVVVVLALSAGYYVYSQSKSAANTETIDLEVTSGTPQNGAPDELLPQNFTVTQGYTVTLVFDNLDDGPHGIQIPALGVSTGVVQGGQTQRTTFVPNQLGTFAIDQPPGWCVDTANPAVSCTGAQEFNGFVTVVAP